MVKKNKDVREKFHNLIHAGDSDTDWEPVISIGTASEKVNLSVSALRKYEKEGLLIYHRTPTGRRLLSRADLKRIQLIHRMIYDLGLNMEGLRRLLALLPCWKLKPCSSEQRKECIALTDASRPCWMIRDSVCKKLGINCRDCLVYRHGAYCTEAIKALLHNLDFDNKE